jgi:hypothetical protein
MKNGGISSAKAARSSVPGVLKEQSGGVGRSSSACKHAQRSKK